MQPLLKQLYKILGWATHPTVVFVILQVAGAAIIVLWVTWFIDQREALTAVARDFGRKNIDFKTGIVFLTLGCVLLGMILVGIAFLFAFAQRQTSLIRQQRNFVSSVTHELRSPLASLQLSFETLAQKDVPMKVSEHLYEIVGSDIDRLTRLVDRILISARLDRGILEFSSSIEDFNLKELLERIRRQTLHLDLALDKRLTLNCDPDLTIRGPKMAFALILGNLLENAINYSPKDTPIAITASIKGDQLHLIVDDKGFGLSKTDCRKIFKMFHRASLATKKAIPGTGLGLYIVRSTAKILGGKVWAESQGLGYGSRFHLMIPKNQERKLS